MAGFMALVRGGSDMASYSPEEMQSIMASWQLWMERLGKEGKITGGEPLDDAASILTGKDKIQSDGPYAETKDAVGGYLLIEAKDLAEATQFVEDCPCFETDCTLEIRPILQLGE